MAKTIDEFRSENSEQVLELQAQLLEKDRILEAYKRGHGQLEVFFNSMESSIKAIKPKPVIYVPGTAVGKSKVEAVMQITDGHMGAVQDANEIEGFNAFNPDLCRSRQVDFASRFCKFVDRMRSGYPIKKCNVLVTGDLISGDIHRELQVTNAFPVTVQVVKAADVLVEQLAIVCQDFEEVVVHFIGEDNHGRLTKKPEAKQAGLNSLNYLVGVLAKAYLRDFCNLKFFIYPMHEKVVTCLNRNYLIAHGHGIRAWMGIPWYSVERRSAKEAQARMQLIMNHKLKMAEVGFHKMVAGHFHTDIDTDLYAFGPSVQGTDAYDHQCGRYSVAGQVAWLIHEHHGDFARVNFKL